ncbi:helix-turn-helix domain-containing protein [Levilactobacillus cerevisiae]|uniref:helix-turn-helix domain-containing protein n=1 Tax=Levilactobacillus cerevisiae TaxID=1704076 RepID=UPI000F7A9FF0|nr:helix-turn-helix transcriptional regulator [Levilactobacillus cerevisiae]
MDNKDLNKMVVARIQYLRHQRKMSQDQLSELSDLPIKYINRIENFKTGFTIATLDKIIQALGVNYQQFFDFGSEINVKDDDPTFEIKKLLSLVHDLETTTDKLKHTLKE